MNWNDLKLFLALIRGGNVRVAAKLLTISHSTVARRLDALETKLGVRLFERQLEGYQLTPDGEDMLAVAETVETEMLGLERRILGKDHQLSGSIRVTLVDALATHVLMPDLVAFCHKYPAIDLRIDNSYESVDLDRREADIAFRFSRNPPEHLIGWQIATLASATYASREYLQNHDLNDAESANWIGFSTRESSPTWRKESQYPNLPIHGQFPSLLIQLAACKHGMGLGMLPCVLGDSEPTLVRLTAAKPDPAFCLWVLTHRDMRTNARLRAFTDFLTATLKRQRPQLEGAAHPNRSATGEA